MTRLYASLRIALKALIANKMRSALTMLGIIIGVSAVITMVAVGSGAKQRIGEQIDLTDGQIVRGTPVRVHQANFVRCQLWAIHVPEQLRPVLRPYLSASCYRARSNTARR